MIFVTGDTHGGMDVGKLSSKNFDSKELTKDDYVIICGDFGFIWNGSKEQWYWINWLRNKPWTTLFIDGNHENFDIINEYPVEIWNGGKVHRINESIIHLMRGQVFTLEGRKFFTFGGGLSIDKHRRTEGVSWWPQEIPNSAEIEEGLKNLESHSFRVDYILTHASPTWICERLAKYKLDDPTCKVLDQFEEIICFNKWYFGHYHVDSKVSDDFIALYNQIVRLT